nr:PREDICTED: protein lifeguard 1-like [Paralichthys olivaceus]XP_019962774.1 PREDICTED: protein lifeguard 1-like [Paralichthys olivaceus]XP_019962775.1 PREDICTED: protein lifeguard 1-like [Paralichthys olivaceus]XP_019962776.1 PREDICTED: protein lifeguard 1-like [Paralichthys olivaceus]
MSDSSDPIASKETQDAPVSEMSSSPPPYSYQQQPPPAYSTVPAMYCPTKTETACTDQPAAYESFHDICPETQSDTTPPVASSSFDDKTVRRGFVRKVFCIVTLQLLFTFSVVCVFTFSSTVQKAVHDDIWVFVSSIIIFAVVTVSLALCKSFRRLYPWNVVGLVVVTLSFSYMVGTLASLYETTAVVVTMGVTLAVTVAIIAFSAQTRYDFTTCYGMLLMLSVNLVIFGFFSIFYYSDIANIAYGCLGALLYSMFLIIDCQLMMGAMSYRLDPEEYINAALNIYLDIILIFLFLLGRR